MVGLKNLPFIQKSSKPSIKKIKATATQGTVCLQRETTDFYVLDKTPAFEDAKNDTQLISSAQRHFLNNKATISSYPNSITLIRSIIVYRLSLQSFI